ncbi:AP-3 complex subunit sigma-2 isoform 1-T1 [Cyanocitta cristata]
MINAILVFNNHGKPRLVRFYQHLAEEVQQQIIRDTFHLVLKRDDHICNFLECGSLFGGSDYKLIYRHYATLYFVFCVDSSESELGILDLIQVFVETLDKCFENVCELDLIFHMDKVHHILQEMVIGGMVLETNMNEIVAQVEAQGKLEKAEGGLSAAPSRAVSAVKNINLPEIPRNINIGDINIKVPNLSQFMRVPFLPLLPCGHAASPHCGEELASASPGILGISSGERVPVVAALSGAASCLLRPPSHGCPLPWSCSL